MNDTRETAKVKTGGYARDMTMRGYYVCWPGCTLNEWVDALQALSDKKANAMLKERTK